jgi:hypothetical protein
MKYERSDGWVYASITNGCNLDSIISYGDVINHSIFNYDELNSGLNRLLTNELIVIDKKLFYKIDNQTPFVKKLKTASKSSRNGLFKLTDIFEKSEMAVIPNYESDVITKEDYNSSLEKHMSIMKELLEKYK